MVASSVSTPAHESIPPHPTPSPRVRMTPRREEFAKLIASGLRASEAHRKAYGPSKFSGQIASKLRREPRMIEAIEWYRADLERQEIRARELAQQQLAALKQDQESRSARVSGPLLSREDRLRILGKIATDPKAKDVDKINAVRVYTAMVGDMGVAVEMPSLDGAPVGPVRAGHMSVRERIKQLQAAMESQGAPVQASNRPTQADSEAIEVQAMPSMPQEGETPINAKEGTLEANAETPQEQDGGKGE